MNSADEMEGTLHIRMHFAIPHIRKGTARVTVFSQHGLGLTEAKDVASKFISANPQMRPGHSSIEISWTPAPVHISLSALPEQHTARAIKA